MSKPSRQRLWQIRQREQGNCVQCGRHELERLICDDCAKKKGVLKRNTRPSVWAAVDWSLNNAQIADKLGVTKEAVHYQRKRRGKPSAKRGRPKKEVPYDPA